MGFFDQVRSMRERVAGMIDDARTRHDIEKLEKEIEQDPDNTFAMQQLCDLFQQIGQNREAVHLMCRIAEVHLRIEKFETASAFYRKAERLASGDERIRILRTLVDLAFQLKRYEDAFIRTRQILEILIGHNELGVARGYLAGLPPFGELDADFRKELTELVNINHQDWAQGARGTWLTDEPQSLIPTDAFRDTHTQFADQTLLIVDDEQPTLDVLTICFKRLGCRIVTAKDGEEAKEVALTERPTLVICDLLMPKMDGSQFFEWMRAQPHLKNVPFVCLSSRGAENERIAAFRRGVEDYWVKPFSVTEITFRVKNLLQRIQPAADFGGKLHEISLPEILQIIEIGRKTGTLKIADGKQEATFFVREGNVVDAKLGDLVGERVAWSVIRWLRGDFAFRSGPIDRYALIKLNTSQLLMEAVRRFDEAQRLIEERPDLDKVYIVGEGFSELPVPEDFAAEMEFLKSLFDGKRKLGECLRILEDDLDSLEMVVELIRENLLTTAR
jgi:DNA-binding response OmpR family regulator